MLNTILKNVTATWFSLVTNIVLSFVMAPITVNALGSVYYGIWTLLMQFTGYLWLADFGVRESVVKYVAQYHASGQKNELVTTVRTAVSLYTLVATIAMLIVTALAIALPYTFNIPAETVTSARIAAFISGATIAQSFVFNVFAGISMGLQLGYKLAPIGFGLSVGRAGLIYLLLTNGFGIVALAVMQGVMSLAFGLLTYRLCKQALPYLTVKLIVPGRDEVRKLVNYGKYVLVTNLGEKIIFSTDSIVIAAFQPISALTFYAIGGTLVEFLRSFVYSMGAAVNPVASTLEVRKDLTRLAELVIAGTKAAVILGLPACIGFVALGERFIALWMGPQYAPEAAAILRVLAIGFAVGLPFSTISATLYGLGQHHYVAYARVAEGIVNLSLSIALVQVLGPVGVAIGTAVPQVFSAFYLPSVLPKLMPLDLKRYYAWTYGRPLLASIPFMAACWAIERIVQPTSLPMFLVIGAASMIVYVVPCWMVALSSDERSRVAGLLRRFRQSAVAIDAPVRPAISQSPE